MTNKIKHIHRIKYDGGRKKPRNTRQTRQTRMLLASRLKVMLADLGLTPETAAQALHVTPRTVRYWISGKTLVPYAAYRLLRLQTGAELPCPGWDGWHMHSGKLWSPEGHGFGPLDSSWWGLLVRKARLFGELYDRDRELSRLMARAGRIDPAIAGDAVASPAGAGASRTPTPEVAGAAQPPRLDLSHKHFGAYSKKTQQTCGFQPDPGNAQQPEQMLVEANNTGRGMTSWVD